MARSEVTIAAFTFVLKMSVNEFVSHGNNKNLNICFHRQQALQGVTLNTLPTLGALDKLAEGSWSGSLHLRLLLCQFMKYFWPYLMLRPEYEWTS